MLKYVLPVAFSLRPSIVYELLRRRIADMVPLNKLLGIEIVSVGDGVGEARLAFRPDLTNHLGTMHASAIFGVAEAASGCAMSGALAPVITTVRPVAASAAVQFSKVARSGLVARARASEPSESLRAKLGEAGKVVFDVVVDVLDDAGSEIARVTVAWHVSSKQA